MIMDIPPSLYAWIFTVGGAPQFYYTYDANGRELLQGVAPTTASTSDSAWVIQQSVYPNGSTSGGPSHMSVLVGVSWQNAILGLLTFP